MLLRRRKIHPSAAALILLLSAAACSEGPVSPSVDVRAVEASTSTTINSTLYTSGELQGDWTLWLRSVWVCKVGPSSTFDVSINGGAPTAVSVADNECKRVHYYAPGWDGDESDPAWAGQDEVVVTENVVHPVVLDSIVRDETHNERITRLATLTGTNSASVTTTRSKGGILVFYNRKLDEPQTLAGCTPGFWRQPQHFQYWVGYSPNTLYGDVFEDAFPGMTLLQVVSLGGGGLNALGRHTVAALLNASNPEVSFAFAYPETVIDMFNAAYPGTKAGYETLKNSFEEQNELGCTAKD